MCFCQLALQLVPLKFPTPFQDRHGGGGSQPSLENSRFSMVFAWFMINKTTASGPACQAAMFIVQHEAFHMQGLAVESGALPLPLRLSNQKRTTANTTVAIW